jgi:hypothetical protein
MVYTIVVHLYAKSDEESIEKLKAKLVEASQVYSKDKVRYPIALETGRNALTTHSQQETLSWFVMQDVADKRKFTIVERYLKESVCSPRILPRYFPVITLIQSDPGWK